MEVNPLLIGPAVDLVGKVFDKIFPDRASAEKAKAEYALQASQIDQAEVDKFNAFVVAYEGEGKDLSPGLQWYRGSVRPTITYALIVALVWAFYSGQPPENVEILSKLNLLSLSFWYGERALKNLGLDLSEWTPMRKAQPAAAANPASAPGASVVVIQPSQPAV